MNKYKVVIRYIEYDTLYQIEDGEGPIVYKQPQTLLESIGCVEEFLNKMSAKGWDLVAESVHKEKVVYIFKTSTSV